MTSPRPHEETSSKGDTTTSQTADVSSSVASVVSTIFVGPILRLCQPQMPTPITMETSGDLVQKATKEGRLQFGERPKMQVDSDPLKVEEALYLEPLECMMVETIEGLMEAFDVAYLA
ncbi:hypothetical protein KIW84_054342 [Lathyrus oleraceus]|uniref:Uncharacterized protein n=1 Tax=Pisum sativum TaxID=3888 RepID=A0A9D4WST9_PEA|nr:hypothetical protein KIW84_054342 [Pisum sativum]